MLEQSFPREVAALPTIYEFVRTALRAWGVPEERAWDVDLVIEELFTNTVKYGRRTAAPVGIALAWSKPLLTIRLRDGDSDFYDPRQAPEPDPSRPLHERRAGGLGLFLVRRMAAAFDYSYEGTASTISVTLRLED